MFVFVPEVDIDALNHWISIITLYLYFIYFDHLANHLGYHKRMVLDSHVIGVCIYHYYHSQRES